MNDLSHINEDFVARCIKSGELQLTDSEKTSHYLPVWFLAAVSVLWFLGGVIHIVNNGLDFDINSIGYEFVLGSLFFLIFSYLIYRKQKKDLQFLSFESDLSLNEKHKIVDLVGKKLNWEKVVNKQNIIIGKVPNIFIWGEKLTVVFHDDKVMISSISDASKKPNLLAPNYKHVITLIDEFEKEMNK